MALALRLIRLSIRLRALERLLVKETPLMICTQKMSAPKSRAIQRLPLRFRILLWAAIAPWVAVSSAASMEDVWLAVSVSREEVRRAQSDPDLYISEFVDYHGNSNAGTLRIEPRLMYNRPWRSRPDLDYLALLNRGGPIFSIGDPDWIFPTFPALDLKVVNNRHKSIVFREILVQVARSEPDLTPLPLIIDEFSPLFTFFIDNQGWGPIESGSLEISVAPQPFDSPPARFQSRKKFGRFTKRHRVDLSREFLEAGLGARYVKKVQEWYALRDRLDREGARTPRSLIEASEAVRAEVEALADRESRHGRFHDGGHFYATLTYHWRDYRGTRQSHTVGLRGTVSLFPGNGGGVAEIAAEYETMLRREGEDYTRRIPVSLPVRGGEVGRFLLRLGVPCTSRHRLRLQLRTIAGESLESQPIEMRTLLLRAQAEELLRQRRLNPR